MLLNISSETSKLLFKSIRLVLIKDNSNVNQYVQSFCNSYIHDENDQEKKRKTPRIPKIKLINTNQSISVISFEDAERLAKRRNLELIHVSDKSKCSKNVYKLVSSSKIGEIASNIKEVHKNKQKIKSTKLFTLKEKITDYDLNTKISNINRALKKKNKVKVFFSHPNGSPEKMIEEMKKKIQGVISGTHTKKDSTIYVYTPLLEDENISLKEDVNDK